MDVSPSPTLSYDFSRPSILRKEELCRGIRKIPTNALRDVSVPIWPFILGYKLGVLTKRQGKKAEKKGDIFLHKANARVEIFAAFLFAHPLDGMLRWCEAPICRKNMKKRQVTQHSSHVPKMTSGMTKTFGNGTCWVHENAEMSGKEHVRVWG